MIQLLFCVLSTSLAQLSPIHLSDQSSTGERQFLDNYGRERFFHGVNAVVKGPPWVPQFDEFNPKTSLVDQDFELLQSLGLNIIRLGTMWPGVAPSNGTYNETYLSILSNMTTKAASYGIYSFLDMHQDVLSEKFCGEGAPAWATYTGDVKQGQNFAFPLGPEVTTYWDTENQFPLRSDCNLYSWGSLYFTNADGKAFQALYQNEHGIRDAWSAFWVKVAQTFAGRSEILAVELINEPWSGDADRHPTLMIPGVADRENLQPAYDALASAIWAVDPERLIMFAAVTWDDIVPVGFEHPPGGSNNSNRTIFTFHFYEAPQFSLQPYFDQRKKDGQKLGTALLLSEFDGNNFNSDKATFDDVTNEADKQLLSWALWEFKDFCIHNNSDPYYANVTQWDLFGACKTGYGGTIWNANGTVNMATAKHWSRTYPQAVAGLTKSFFFDPTKGVFNLAYIANPTITQPTVIYLNENIFYPNGYDVLLTGNATWKKETTNFVNVYNGASANDVTITITPK